MSKKAKKKEKNESKILFRLVVVLVFLGLISFLVLIALESMMPIPVPANQTIKEVQLQNMDRVNYNISNATCIVKEDNNTYCSRYAGARP